MKKIVLTFAWILLTISPLSAIKLSEVLATKPVGRNLEKWKASEFVSEHLAGKLFAVPSELRKVWQLRFFSFEDRNKILDKKNSFSEFVKKFDLEDLESNEDSVPYNDGTLHSFTYNTANDFLIKKGKAPLPEGMFFVISFREVMK